VGTIADAGCSPKLPPDQADEFVKHRCLLRSSPPRMPAGQTTSWTGRTPLSPPRPTAPQHTRRWSSPRSDQAFA